MKTPANTTLITNINILMDINKIKINALGDKSKVSSRMIRFILDGTRNPSLEVIEKIGEAFNKTASEMLTPFPDDISESSNEEYAIETKNHHTAVCGTAQLGPDGYWHELTQGTEGYIDAPTNDPDAYSIKVVGDSMRPALKSGWYVVCEPNHDIVIGEFVLLQTKEGKSMVKELLIANDQQYVLGSINEDYGRITLDPKEVEKIHYVAFIAPPSKHSI